MRADQASEGQSIGRHLVCWVFGGDQRLLSDAARLLEELETLCRERNLTVLQTFTHAYQPFGLTVGLVLGESHLILHTWPERNLVHIDFFSCLDFNAAEAAAALQQRLAGANVQIVLDYGEGGSGF